MKSKKIYSLLLSAALALGTVAPGFAADAVAPLVNQPFASGYPDNGFKPNNFITRAELAVLITRAFKLTQTSSSFSDTKNHWADKYVGALQTSGYAAGYPGGTYQPEAMITRAELATMLNKIYKGSTDLGAKSFVDVTAADWFRPHVEEAAKKGIVAGYGDGQFGPMDRVTRAQAVTMVLNALDRNPDSDLPKLILSSLNDIDNNAWYAKYVLSATEAYKYTKNADGSENATRDTSFVTIDSAKVIDAVYDKDATQAMIQFSVNGMNEAVTKEALAKAGYSVKYYVLDNKGDRFPGALVNPITNTTNGEVYSVDGKVNPSALAVGEAYTAVVVITDDTDDNFVLTVRGTIQAADKNLNIVKQLTSIKFENRKAELTDAEVLTNSDISNNKGGNNELPGTANGIQLSSTIMQGEKLVLKSLKGTANDKTDVELKDMITVKPTSSNPDVADFKEVDVADSKDVTPVIRPNGLPEYELIARAAGKTTVTYTVGTQKFTKEITVVKNNQDTARKVDSIKVEPAELRVIAGNTQTFKVTIYDQYGDPMELKTCVQIYSDPTDTKQSKAPRDWNFISAAVQRANVIDGSTARESFRNTYDNLNIIVPQDAKNNDMIFDNFRVVGPNQYQDGSYTLSVRGAKVGDGVMYFVNETNKELATVKVSVTEIETLGERELREVNDYKASKEVVLDLTNSDTADNTASLNVAQLTKAGEYLEQVEIQSVSVDNTKIATANLNGEKTVITVTPGDAGETTLTVVDKDGKSYTTKIVVKKDAKATITEVENWVGDGTNKTNKTEIRDYKFNELLPQADIRTNLNVLYTTNPVTMNYDLAKDTLNLEQVDKDGVSQYVGYAKVYKYTTAGVKKDITKNFSTFDDVVITKAESREDKGATVLVEVYGNNDQTGYISAHTLYVNANDPTIK